MSYDQPLQLRKFDGGINTKQSANKLDENQLQSIISMDFTANTLRRAKGYEVFGDEPDSDLVGKSIYTHTILDGVELMLKVIGGYLKYYDENSGKWLKAVDHQFTKGERWSFETFNSHLYANNGVDNWIFWNAGAKSTNQNELDSNTNKIELANNHGGRFPSSGTVMIEDQSIDYSSKSGDTLEGISGEVSGTIEAGATVILKADKDTHSGVKAAKDIAFHKNRLFFIVADTPTTIKHSKLADSSNPEDDLINFTVSGSGTGDAGFAIAPDTVQALEPLITGSNDSILSALIQNGNAYSFSVTDANSTTTQVFIPLRTMNTYPTASHMKTIAENDIVMVDNIGHIRSLAQGDTATPVQVQSISELIEPSLEDTDFTDGAIKYWSRRLWAAGSSEEAKKNDIIFYRDSQYEAWGAYGHWNVNDFTVYDDKLFSLSSTGGEVYELDKGYNADGGDYYSEFVTKEFDLNRPHSYKQLIKMRITGLITNNATINFSVFYDNSSNPIEFEIDGDNDDIVLSSDPDVAIGSVVFGEGTYGGGLPGGTTRREFAGQIVFNEAEPFLKFSMRVSMDDSDVDFEITDLTTYIKESSVNVWNNNKYTLNLV